MSRLSNQNIVINVTDDDITDFVKDLTILPPKGKENSEPIKETPSVLKRRKSVKTKQNETLNKTNNEALHEQNEYDNAHVAQKETNHFEFSSSTHSKTSNNKLEQSHRITYAEMLEVLDVYKYKHHDLIEKLSVNYEQYFDKWMQHMKFGFNVLLFGLGSKKILIEKFLKSHLKHDFYLTFLGYHPDMNSKSIIKSIVLNVLHVTDNLKTYDEQINAIKTKLGNFPRFLLTPGISNCVTLDRPLYLIIHNIDGACLRDSEIQYRLSELATIDNIHFIASIDHINSALLWDHMQLASFKWIYYDVSTFKSYNEEIMFENSLMVSQTGNVQLSSLIHVLKSLTQNAKNIFIIMANHALNADKNKKCIAFSKLYYECRERFYVSNELTLRAQLTEFIDHKLIKLKTESDGSEMIYLLVDDTNLKLYLDELKDKV